MLIQGVFSELKEVFNYSLLLFEVLVFFSLGLFLGTVLFYIQLSIELLEVLQYFLLWVTIRMYLVQIIFAKVKCWLSVRYVFFLNFTIYIASFYEKWRKCFTNQHFDIGVINLYNFYKNQTDIILMP